MVNNPNQINFISEYNLSEIITDEKLQVFVNQVLSYNYKTKNLKLFQRIELYEPKIICDNFIKELKWFPKKINRLDVQLDELNQHIANYEILKDKCIKFSKKRKITNGDLEFLKNEINELGHVQKIHLLANKLSLSVTDFTSSSSNNKIYKSTGAWSVKMGISPRLIKKKDPDFSGKIIITLANHLDEGIQIVKVSFKIAPMTGHATTQYWKKDRKNWKLLKEDLTWIS